MRGISNCEGPAGLRILGGLDADLPKKTSNINTVGDKRVANREADDRKGRGREQVRAAVLF